MTTSRRDVIKGTLALAGRGVVFPGGIGVSAALTSCGGGGSSAPEVVAPSGLSYSSPAQATVGTAASTLTPTVTGTVASYSVSPSLPAGLSLNSATGVISGTPTAAAAQGMYTVTATNAGGSTTFALSLTVNPALAITAVSNSSPTALTAISLSTTGLDTTSPYTLTFTNSGGGSIAIAPIRTESTGVVVVPVPLAIDAASGGTTSVKGTLQITQNSVTSAATPLTISDLPSLADLGLSPGQLSQAFNTYQTLSLGANINMQQAIGMLPGAKGVPGSLLTNLQTQLLGTINARNVIDNIVANSAYSMAVGSANDGTAINFNQASVTVLDRILAQYLAALTNQSAVSLAVRGARSLKNGNRHYAVAPTLGLAPRSIISEKKTALSQSASELARTDGIGAFVTALTTLGGAAAVVGTGQTLLSKNSSTADEILSVASTAATIITIGATIVAATAAAPEIAAGAIVVAAYSSLAGVAIGSLMVGNDIYNLGTSLSTLANSAPGSPAYALAYANAQSAGANLVADGATTVMNAVGIGAFEAAASGSVLPAAMSVLDQVFAPAATDVTLGVSGLLISTANIYAQNGFDEDINNAKANLGQAPSPTAPVSGEGFALVDGTVDITNSNGPILSPLTGVEVGTATDDNLLTTMADANGNYSFVVPLGSSSLTYDNTTLSAYDPISGTVLDTTDVDLSSLAAPNQSVTEPIMSGECIDTDATDPDGDDPDCDET